MKVHQLQKRQQAKAQRALRIAMGDLILFSRERNDVTFTPRADFYVNRRGTVCFPLATAIRNDERIHASYSYHGRSHRVRMLASR